jgi:YidC/Oxa1 family membrane protein insertase
LILFANILQPLIDIASAVLVFFHDNASFGWGASIIALTFLTRALLIPLTYKQIKGMRALQALQPQIKEIQQKYKNDRQRMQQEMMRFYQQNKVNPFASCIPLLAQLPVFITLFYALREDLRFDICGQTDMPCGELQPVNWAAGLIPGSESFLFIPDLTDKAEGGVLIALVVIYVATQLAAGLVMMTSADATQRTLMFVLPIIFVPFIITFPAGLVLYWITTNVWTIGQQYAVKKLIPPPAVPTPEEVRAAKPPPPPPRKRKKRRR